MGHDLYRMAFAAFRPDWTSGERVVILSLADICNDRTRRPPPGFNATPRILEETGLTAAALSKNLTTLAAKGCELRVPIGTDKHGRPVFAAKGHAVDYRFPLLRPRGCEGPVVIDEEGPLMLPVSAGTEAPTVVGASVLKVRPQSEHRTQRSDCGRTPNPQRPNTPNDLFSPDQPAHTSPVTAEVESRASDLSERLARYIPDSEAS